MITLEILEKLNTLDPKRWYRMDSELNNSFCWMFVASETKHSICGESDKHGENFTVDSDCVGPILVWLTEQGIVWSLASPDANNHYIFAGGGKYEQEIDWDACIVTVLLQSVLAMYLFGHIKATQ